MRIALSVWQGRISPVFDTSQKVIMVEVENGREVSRTEEWIGEAVLPQRAAKINDFGVDVLLCGAVSRPLHCMLLNSNLKVIPFLAGEADLVLEAYMTGKLTDTRLPGRGCCGRRQRFRGRR